MLVEVMAVMVLLLQQAMVRQIQVQVAVVVAVVLERAATVAPA